MCHTSGGISGFNILLLIFFTTVLFGICNSSISTETCSYSPNINGSCVVQKIRNNSDNSTFNKQNHTSTINWKIRPQSIAFHYYLRTSENGDDLSVRGRVNWKIQFKNWTNKSETQPTVDGFRIQIIDHSQSKNVAEFIVTINEDFDEFASENEAVELRLEFDEILEFGKNYDAKIDILPLGKQMSASSFREIIPKQVGQTCSEMSVVAFRWAPHIEMDILEYYSALNISWKTAPSFLCIKNYQFLLVTEDNKIIHSSVIETEQNQKIANVFVENVPRNTQLLVKVQAVNSTLGKCACHHCNCMIGKSRLFNVPFAESMNFSHNPISLNSTLILAQEYSETTMSLLLMFSLVFISMFIISICLIARRYNPVMKQHITFKSMALPMFHDRFRKGYRILLVFPTTNSNKETQYIESVCTGMRDSRHTVVCDRFDEFAEQIDQNMIQWIYKESALADKILLFHTSHKTESIGVYDVLNALLPKHDERLINVHLSQAVKLNSVSVIDYILPRDEQIFEREFGVTISKSPPLLDSTVEDIIQLVDQQSINISFESFEETNKMLTLDSGVSSMSRHSSNNSELLLDTINTDINFDVGLLKSIKHIQSEDRPLLRQQVAV